MWIWMLDKIGLPDEVVRKAVMLGLSGILVKAWDGGTTGIFLQQFMKIVKVAHDAGLTVGAWGYSYGNNIIGEARAAEAAIEAGADWIIVDAEVEYENPSGGEKALTLGDTLTQLVGKDTVIGYTTFAIPDFHPAFPYRQFSTFCSVCLPQMYWGLMSLSLDEVFCASLKSLKKYHLPIAPVGQSFGKVNPDEIVRFALLAKENNLDGISYYDWQHATNTQLDAVGKAPYGRYLDVSNWARVAWNKATIKGLFDGTEPKGTVTREMLAVILDRLGLLDSYAGRVS